MSAAVADSPPSIEGLAAAVRRGLDLHADDRVLIREDGELSNINYVYRVEVPGRSLYLKVVPERPRRLPIQLPRERVFSEAEGMRRFRELANGLIDIPDVLFVDRDEMAFGMSDVGVGREVLFPILGERFDLLAEQAEPLGRALGLVHAGTRFSSSPRPAQEEEIVRKVIFDGLLAPGARVAFPEWWDDVRAEMQRHRECLVHSDLWTKNLLAAKGRPIAVVDFEGVCLGDPAFDLATLAAAALLPAFDRPRLLLSALTFCRQLLVTWTDACESHEWAGEVLPRVFRTTATFLAARGFGPFAYTMSDGARERVQRLAASLAAQPPSGLHRFLDRITEIA